MTEPAPSDAALIGAIVGNYKILRRLSRGGMGTVYCAEHTLIGRNAAIKVLHPEFSGNTDIVNRFFNEAKATTSIKHPGIVEVFEFGYMPSGDGYLVMEFLDGMPLSRRLKKGARFSEGEAAMLIRSVCGALAAAHAKGIVHRDLKPDNIFLVEDPESQLGERPKLLDFGIAKLTDVGLAGTATKTGAVMGTPTYMSPEQCKGTGEVDHRADLYSLGCILYELVRGRPPFANLGAGELIGAHLHVIPDAPSKYEPLITPALEKLILMLLDKQPANRPQSALELAQRLGTIAMGHGYQVTHPSGALTPWKQMQAQRIPDDNKPLRTELNPEIEVTPATALADVSATSAGTVSEQPTTLSGAAKSQPVIEVVKRRRGYGLVAAALLAVGGTVAVIVMTASPRGGPAPSAQPPTAATTPGDLPGAVSAPAVTNRPPPPAVAPTATAEPAPPPTANVAPEQPVATKPVPAKPRVTHPAAAKLHTATTKPNVATTKPNPTVVKPKPAGDKPATVERIPGPIATDID